MHCQSASCPYYGVSPAQRRVHIVTEAAAVAVLAPFLWWASSQTEHPLARWGLRGLSLATIAVDAPLVARWWQAEPMSHNAREASHHVDETR